MRTSPGGHGAWPLNICGLDRELRKAMMCEIDSVAESTGVQKWEIGAARATPQSPLPRNLRQQRHELRAVCRFHQVMIETSLLRFLPVLFLPITG